MTVAQQNSGLFTSASAADLTVTLPGASSSGNRIVLVIAGNTVITGNPAAGATVNGWSLRNAQVNFMGHYLLDRVGGASSWTVPMNGGGGTWWVEEVVGGAFDTALGANDPSGSLAYSTPSLTPTSGLRHVVASIGSTQTNGIRTISGWTNSFLEQADLCQAAVADFPMQGAAILDNVTTSGATYSTTATYSLNSVGRTAIIGSYVTTASTSVTGTATGAANAVAVATGTRPPTGLTFAAVTTTGTVVGAGSAQAVLSDSDDTTYIRLLTGQLLDGTLRALTAAPTADFPVTFRGLRVDSTSGSLAVTLRDGATTVATATVGAVGTSAADVVATFTLADLSSVTLATWQAGTLVVRATATVA